MARHDDAHTRYRQWMLAGVLFAGIGVFDTLEGLSGWTTIRTWWSAGKGSSSWT